MRQKRMIVIGAWLLLLVGAGVLFAGRGETGADPMQTRELTRDGAAEPGFAVAVNEAEMTALWQGLVQPRERPEVDFAREWVLAAFMGEKPTGGFRVTIDQVERRGEEIRAQISEREPGPDDFVTMVFTYPGQVVAVERPSEAGVYTLIIHNRAGEEKARLSLTF